MPLLWLCPVPAERAARSNRGSIERYEIVNNVHQTAIAAQSAVQEAILAAQAGHQSLARFRLEQAITTEYDNPNYWLWMAWTSESPTAAVSALEQSIKIAPDHRIAQQGLAWARTMQGFLADSYQSSAATRAAERASIDDGFQSPQSILSPLSTQPTMHQRRSSDTTAADPSPDRRQPYGTAGDLHNEFEPGYEFERVPGDSTNSPQAVPEPTTTETWSPTNNPDQQTTPRVEEDDFRPPEEPENLHVFPINAPKEHWPIGSTPTPPPMDPSPETEDPTEHQFSGPTCDGATVLAVHDNPTVRETVVTELETVGYRVVTASDSVEAIKRLNESRPSLILISLNTPPIDGYQFLKLLKSHEQTRDIPVIMLSSNEGILDETKGEPVGCDGYVTAPIQSLGLLEKVTNYLPLPVSEK